jgi:N-acetyl sugar amidotransferase
MRYCQRCVYPENTKPMILFDEKGVCSGCKLIESRKEFVENKINWTEREQWFCKLLNEYKQKARENGSPYDCIIPVSGGKDSHYQVHLIKNVYGLNPLLVTYNHSYNTKRGIRNLNNMVKKFGCDLIRFTTNPHAAAKISRYMLKKVGDITWHYHAGIKTFPIQMAVQYKIPLMIWGEVAFAELTGMFNQDDMAEFTKKVRREHSMRGFEPGDILHDPENTEITKQDLAPFFYPSDEDIEKLGLKGIYVSNFINWNARPQTREMIENYGFETHCGPRQRTFNLYDKLEDWANPIHDYLKYLKFGYGRTTDDASTEIRHGRMSREQGIEKVRTHDHVRPKEMDRFLEFLGITEQKFLDSIGHLRDMDIWKQKDDGTWVVKDSVVNHIYDSGVEAARLSNIREWQEFVPANVPKNISPEDLQNEDLDFTVL